MPILILHGFGWTHGLSQRDNKSRAPRGRHERAVACDRTTASPQARQAPGAGPNAAPGRAPRTVRRGLEHRRLARDGLGWGWHRPPPGLPHPLRCALRPAVGRHGARPGDPLSPVHLVVAALLGLVLWRVEHRLTRLRAQIAGRLTALIVAGSTEDAAARWRQVTLRPLAWSAPTLFARPPPSVA